MCTHVLSGARLFATPQTVALQAPLSMKFSRQGGWSGLPLPAPGDIPDPGIKGCDFCVGRQILYHWCHLGEGQTKEENMPTKETGDPLIKEVLRPA